MVALATRENTQNGLVRGDASANILASTFGYTGSPTLAYQAGYELNRQVGIPVGEFHASELGFPNGIYCATGSTGSLTLSGSNVFTGFKPASADAFSDLTGTAIRLSSGQASIEGAIFQDWKYGVRLREKPAIEANGLS